MPSTAPAHCRRGLPITMPTRRFLSDTSRFGVKIVMSGPLVSDDGATMIGSLFLIESPGRAEVEAFNRADPFAAAGIWEKVTITGFLRRQG